MTINVTFDSIDELEEFSRTILYSPALRKPRSEMEPAGKGRRNPKPEPVPDRKTIEVKRGTNTETESENENVKTDTKNIKTKEEDVKRKTDTAGGDVKREKVSGFKVIENSKTEKAPLKTKPRKKLDMGKIIALKNAGWDVKKIADEMHCSTWSVYNATKHYKSKGGTESNERETGT